MRFTDEGVDDHGGDKAWGDESHCECCDCMFSGIVADFTNKPQQEEAAMTQYRNTIVHADCLHFLPHLPAEKR
ncbi:MAG: hypothetical protein ACR2I2_10905 [Bryobacteraceae bacterium]